MAKKIVVNDCGDCPRHHRCDFSCQGGQMKTIIKAKVDVVKKIKLIQSGIRYAGKMSADLKPLNQAVYLAIDESSSSGLYHKIDEIPDLSGEYVRKEDHDAEIERLKAQLAELREAVREVMRKRRLKYNSRKSHYDYVIEIEKLIKLVGVRDDG